MSLQNYPTAPLLRRLAALAYDSLVVMALYILVGFIVVGILKATSGDFPGELPASISFSLIFIVCFFYYSHSWRRGGQTIGMKAWRIRLINENTKHGQMLPIQLSQCMLRTGIGFFSLIIFGAGFIWMLFDVKNRTWHDLASVTRVIYLPKDME